MEGSIYLFAIMVVLLEILETWLDFFKSCQICLNEI